MRVRVSCAWRQCKRLAAKRLEQSVASMLTREISYKKPNRAEVNMDRKQHWEMVYSTKSDEEVSWFQSTPDTSLAMIGSRPLSSRIIDIGGGASRLVDALLDRGYSALSVLDISEAALSVAKDRLGSRAGLVNWIVADITQWQPSGAFDVWHDRAVFHFLTDADDRRAYIDALTMGLAKGGAGLIATFAENGPERCSGLPVRRYSSETLAAELGPRFRLVDSLSENHRTPGGNEQRFQFSRFQRG